MLSKALIIAIAVGIVLSVFCKVLYDQVGELKEANKTLQRALETNLKATKEKDKRNNEELQQLQKQITGLNKISDSCLTSPVSGDLVKFLQQLQQDSAGTISFTFTE